MSSGNTHTNNIWGEYIKIKWTDLPLLTLFSMSVLLSVNYLFLALLPWVYVQHVWGSNVTAHGWFVQCVIGEMIMGCFATHIFLLQSSCLHLDLWSWSFEPFPGQVWPALTVMSLPQGVNRLIENYFGTARPACTHAKIGRFFLFKTITTVLFTWVYFYSFNILFFPDKYISDWASKVGS